MKPSMFPALQDVLEACQLLAGTTREAAQWNRWHMALPSLLLSALFCLLLVAALSIVVLPARSPCRSISWFWRRLAVTAVAAALVAFGIRQVGQYSLPAVGWDTVHMQHTATTDGSAVSWSVAEGFFAYAAPLAPPTPSPAVRQWSESQPPYFLPLAADAVELSRPWLLWQDTSAIALLPKLKVSISNGVLELQSPVPPDFADADLYVFVQDPASGWLQAHWPAGADRTSASTLLPYRLPQSLLATSCTLYPNARVIAMLFKGPSRHRQNRHWHVIWPPVQQPNHAGHIQTIEFNICVSNSLFSGPPVQMKLAATVAKPLQVPLHAMSNKDQGASGATDAVLEMAGRWQTGAAAPALQPTTYAVELRPNEDAAWQGVGQLRYRGIEEMSRQQLVAEINHLQQAEQPDMLPCQLTVELPPHFRGQLWSAPQLRVRHLTGGLPLLVDQANLVLTYNPAQVSP